MFLEVIRAARKRAMLILNKNEAAAGFDEVLRRVELGEVTEIQRDCVVIASIVPPATDRDRRRAAADRSMARRERLPIGNQSAKDLVNEGRR